jgi:hypothetical protein
MIETPELDKIRKAREDGGSSHIGAFLEWAESNGYRLTKEVAVEVTDFWDNTTEETGYVPVSAEEALAAYFEIDMAKADKERRALMDVYIAANEKHRDTYKIHLAPEEDPE